MTSTKCPQPSWIRSRGVRRHAHLCNTGDWWRKPGRGVRVTHLGASSWNLQVSFRTYVFKKIHQCSSSFLHFRYLQYFSFARLPWDSHPCDRHQRPQRPHAWSGPPDRPRPSRSSLPVALVTTERRQNFGNWNSHQLPIQYPKQTKTKAVKWAQGYQKRENLVLCLTNIQRWLPAAALEGCHCDQGSCWAKQSAHCPPAATDEFTLARPFFRQNEFSFANGIWSWLWQVPPCKPEASSPCIYAWKALPPPTDVKLKWNPTHKGDLGGFSFFVTLQGWRWFKPCLQGSSEYSSAWLLCKVSKVLLMVALRHTRCQQKHPKHATPPEFGLSQTIQNTNLEDCPEIRKLEMLRLRR